MKGISRHDIDAAVQDAKREATSRFLSRAEIGSASAYAIGMIQIGLKLCESASCLSVAAFCAFSVEMKTSFTPLAFIACTSE